jgi:hypothetical protein
LEKEIVVKFDSEAYQEYLRLKQTADDSGAKPTSKQLLDSIDMSILRLKANPFYGDQIPRKYLSKALISSFGTDKLFRIELVGFWRLIYTVIGNEAKIVALILEYMNHDRYNKLFGYKKR